MGCSSSTPNLPLIPFGLSTPTSGSIRPQNLVVSVGFFGKTGSGKTCLIHRLRFDEWLGNIVDITVGVDIVCESIHRIDREYSGRMVKIAIHDMGGQYSSFWAAYTRSLDLALYVVKCDDPLINLERITANCSKILQQMQTPRLMLVFTGADSYVNLLQADKQKLKNLIDVLFQRLHPITSLRLLVSSLSGEGMNLFRSEFSRLAVAYAKPEHSLFNCEKKIGKLIVLGPSGVGKSSFLQCAIYGKVVVLPETTIGLDFYTMPIKMKNGDLVGNLQLWDTSGQVLTLLFVFFIAFRSVSIL